MAAELAPESRGRVRIGDSTLLGPFVQICAPLHPFDAVRQRREEFGGPLETGAGTMVTRNVPEGTFATGSPCRVIHEITA